MNGKIDGWPFAYDSSVAKAPSSSLTLGTNNMGIWGSRPCGSSTQIGLRPTSHIPRTLCGIRKETDKMKLKDIDKSYRDSIMNTISQLKKTSNIIENEYSFDLEKKDISVAILERLRVFYKTQQETKSFLNKRYQTAGADFFVETIIFFIQLYLKSEGSILEVHSERQIRPKKRMIRPDISIWKGDEVLAIIECKTQLGWNRNNWEKDFNSRKQKLTNEFPNAKAFLLVMTGLNWNGFGNSEKLGVEYFCFLDKVWPTDYKNESQIMSTIEKLLKILIKLN